MQKISIVLPIKDTARYLVECIDSIISQSFKNWELLAVNDDSSDNCWSIIQEYAKNDARIIAINNSNPGLLNALRLGYSKSTGEIIHRMDSDDIMPKDKLKSMLNAGVDEKGNWKKGTVITGATEYFSDEGPIGDGFKRYDKWLMNIAKNQSYRKEVYKECVIPSNCWLIHRSDFDRIEAFEPATFPEDYDLCFRFISGGLNVIGLPKILHHWRDRSDRISRNWEEYKDNRFFELKVHYFFKMDRNHSRPLVLWGAGKNGKDLAKLILKMNKEFTWVCDNEKKIGKDIYDVRMHHYQNIENLDSPQIIIPVASPDGQIEIEQELQGMNLQKGIDYWFFS